MSVSLGSITLKPAFALSLFAALVLAAPVARGQDNSSNQTTQKQVATTKVNTPDSTNVATIPSPVFTDYRGVRVGMSTDEVRGKLDHLKEKSKTQDFFVFSDAESVQVYYDGQGKVTAVSVSYVGDDSKAPKPESVIGHAVTPKADGSAYELVRYPQAGYWVAYSRTAGSNPIITVTMQKLP